MQKSMLTTCIIIYRGKRLATACNLKCSTYHTDYIIAVWTKTNKNKTLSIKLIYNGNWTEWSVICIGNHTVFLVQFGINLHEWIFQKAYLLIIQTWKNSRKKIAGRCFFKFFFCIRENVFQSFRTKFLSLLYMISLSYKISYCLSANHYPELRCVLCTGVTLFAPVLHFLHWCYTWTALLSANQNGIIFSCVLLGLKSYGDSKIERTRSASSILKSLVWFMHSTQFNCHFIRSILKSHNFIALIQDFRFCVSIQ